MTAGHLIALRQLSKEYVMGDSVVHALREISLVIDSGEFAAIMGASGSGKSTLMNILGCLDTPTSGAYILDGEEIQQMEQNRLARLRNIKMGFVFQAFNLLTRTTALENVELPMLYNKDFSAAQCRKKALEALGRVGLHDRAFHYANQLSGGQQQRVAIARAIVNDPLIILADEPTGNLDSHMSIEIMALFQRLNASGITVIMVTHEPDIARYASRKITFRDGTILSDEPVHDRGRAA
ncbi:MAG: ABC transporter ATP-binding protein [Chitinispirillaceae bacterium]|jgi:putative ABC transport system ATP-binding protein|nr:ABC transporter ATP-binding protein [Chitinispirillaceae bacterium]